MPVETTAVVCPPCCGSGPCSSDPASVGPSVTLVVSGRTCIVCPDAHCAAFNGTFVLNFIAFTGFGLLYSVLFNPGVNQILFNLFCELGSWHLTGDTPASDGYDLRMVRSSNDPFGIYVLEPQPGDLCTGGTATVSPI